MDERLTHAQGFVAQVFRMASWRGELPPVASFSQRGAEAMAGLVLAHPIIAGGDGPADERVRLFGPTDDPGLEALRYDAVGYLLASAIAVGLTRDLDDALAGALVHAAASPDPRSLFTRATLVRRRLFELPPKPFPDWLEPIGRFVERNCFAGVVGAVLELGRWASSRLSSDANGISGLSSKNVCPNTVLTIYGGGFGSAQPGDVRVYVPVAGGGCREAHVERWTSTEIDVRAPADIGPGCVGFVRGTVGFAEPQRVTGELTSCIGAAAEMWTRGFQRQPSLAASCPPCLQGDANRIDVAGPPQVNTFRFAPDRVEPGGQPVLSWNVSNATSVRIDRVGTTGPLLTLPNPLPPTGTYTLPPIGGLVPVTGPYRLTAQNGCGTTVRDASFSMSRSPKLSVARIEVVQSIQRPDNSVRLTAGRLTAVRVFVDSGITDGFDLGDGPGRVSGLQVSVLAQNLDTGATRDCGPPWAPGQAGQGLNRDLLADSVNFDVPLVACRGTVRFRATVTIPSELGAPPVAFANGSVDVSFQPKSAQELTPILITDPANPGPAPTMADVGATLLGPARAHPFPENGFSVNPPLALLLSQAESLYGPLAFPRLSLKLATMIFLFPSTPVGGIRFGIIQQDSRYPNCGVALPRIGATAPALAVQAGNTSCCTHELGHTYGLQHVNACGAPWPHDGGLPFTISDPGINVANRSILAAGTSESMTYCGPDWPSIEHWDRIYDRIPIS
jgi:hypothetical protein